MELLRKATSPPPELAAALEALSLANAALKQADKATGRRPTKRAKALAALAKARTGLEQVANEPTMREVESTNWSSARFDRIYRQLQTAAASLEGSTQ